MNLSVPVGCAACLAGTGILFGLDPDSMVIGFVAGLTALLHVAPPPTRRTPFRVFLLVAGSAFLAGVFGPIAAAAFLDQFAWAGTIDPRALRIACAAAIGGGVHLPWAKKLLMERSR